MVRKLILIVWLLFAVVSPTVSQVTTTDREYVNNQAAWIRAYTDAEIKAVREAVDKVERTNTAYRETQNELRNQMKDMQGTFVTRRELWAAVIAVCTLIISGMAVVVNYIKKTKPT